MPGDEGPSARYQPWHGLARAGLYRSRVTTSSGGRDNSVHSVDRAISVLQVLARLGAAGVTEISTELDVHKSTVSRLLGTLEARGLVEQNSSRGHYRLGYGVVQLAVGATKKYDLPVVSRPISHVLAEVVGETVNVAVRDGNSVVSIDQVIGSATMTTVNWVGQRTPLHATSAGKVFLAHAAPGELAAILAEGLERFTGHTITDPEELSRQLDEVRLAGYAYSIETSSRPSPSPVPISGSTRRPSRGSPGTSCPRPRTSRNARATPSPVDPAPVKAGWAAQPRVGGSSSRSRRWRALTSASWVMVTA